MEARTAVLHVAIDVGSDPISGSVAAGDSQPRRFAGWVELAAEIEALRQAGRDVEAASAPQDPLQSGTSDPGAPLGFGN